MTNVLIPIADGTEEMEATIAIDVLRRAGATVDVVSVMNSQRTVLASRDVRIEADYLITECPNRLWDMIVLPGGMPGAQHLQQCGQLVSQIKSQLEAKRWVAAICAAPAVVLGRCGFLASSTATCHPSFQQELAQYANQVSSEPVVIDRNVVTSQGPGTAMQFALHLVAVLFDNKKALEIANAMVFDWQP